MDPQARDSNKCQKYVSHDGACQMHTPTPWIVDAMGYIRGPESENILENHENAEFVCRAVNVHEDLLDAIKSIIDEPTEKCWNRDNILDLIARAEGKI